MGLWLAREPSRLLHASDSFPSLDVLALAAQAQLAPMGPVALARVDGWGVGQGVAGMGGEFCRGFSRMALDVCQDGCQRLPDMVSTQ